MHVCELSHRQSLLINTSGVRQYIFLVNSQAHDSVQWQLVVTSGKCFSECSTGSSSKEVLYARVPPVPPVQAMQLELHP